MAAETACPAPPQGLRPAQAGIVLLGRPILGHAAITLVDLRDRGVLRITEVGDGVAVDWQLERAHPPRSAGDTDLLPYEDGLLGDLIKGDGTPLLSGLTGQLAPALKRFRRGLVHDAVRRGWLRHRHPDQRTEDGDRLVVAIRSFRTGLRQLKASDGEDALASRLPYALLFGLASWDRLPRARFAAAWIQACSSLPGWQHDEPKRPQPGDPDFTRDEWRGMGLAGAQAMLWNL